MRLGAVVVLDPGAPADAVARVRERCRGRLAALEIPRAIVRLDEIPSLASGTTDRATITRLLAAALRRPLARLEGAPR